MNKLLPAAVVTLMVSSSAFAGACNNLSIKGDFSYQMERLETGSTYPVVSIGRVTYDGLGNLTVTDTSTVGGAVYPDTGTGTYTVAADCTVTSTTTMTGSGATLSGKTILDRVKVGTTTNVAFHGVSVAWDATNNQSYKGSSLRVIGK